MGRNKGKVNKSKSGDDLYKELGKRKPHKSLEKSINPLKSKKSSKSILKSSQSKKREEIKKEKYQPPPEKPRIKKEKSMVHLSVNLSERLQIDRSAKTKLQKLSFEQLQKKEQLEEKIKDIRKKNLDRVKELENFQDIYLKKVQSLIKEDKKKQQKLLQEYEKTADAEDKLKSARLSQELAEIEDWKAILAEKSKIQKMMRDYRKKQEILMNDQSPEGIEKAKRVGEKKKKVEKKVEVKAQKVKGDAKKMGNQYLQFAKMLQESKKKKVKLLDINNKNIDYEGEMVTKISRNTGDLSKYRKIQIVNEQVPDERVGRGIIKSSNLNELQKSKSQRK